MNNNDPLENYRRRKRMREESSINNRKVGNISDSLSKVIDNEILSDDYMKNKGKNLKKPIKSKNKKRKKKRSIFFKAFLIFITIIVIFLVGVGIYLWTLMNRINSTKFEDAPIMEGQISEEELERMRQTFGDNIKWDITNQKKSNKNIINILLVGEEAIEKWGHGRGRSDSMMIATVNSRENTIKLTSLMRDVYVRIPGYLDNKLNAAYNMGGIPLLKQTIETNYDIVIDYSAVVQFSGFEKIIDQIGGVEISLTADEAQYLNTTNYISKKKYRNVVEGKQILNGNQALGFARIRYRASSNGEANDFGRTNRQRMLIQAVVNKLKSKNLLELTDVVNGVLSNVLTDLPKSEIVNIIKVYTLMKDKNLETFRVPIDNSYEDRRIRGMSVLVIDFAENKRALHKFIFGTED